MNDYINVRVMGKEVKIPPGTTYEELSRDFRQYFKSPIMVACNGTRLRELTKEAEPGADVEFFDLTNPEGFRIYRRSVSFLMILAAKELYGKDIKVVVEHSLKRNLYCEIERDGACIAPDAKAMGEKMRELSALDLPIEKRSYTRDKAIEIMKQCAMTDKVELFRFRRSSNVNLYKLGDLYDYFYGYMVPSTGYLKSFDVADCEAGFLIMFPSEENPEIIPEYIHPAKVSRMFLEQRNWQRLMNVKTVADLNNPIVRGKFPELVRINEALHNKKISRIADMITERIGSVKVVMIAGPSSSGKTTFAQKLCLELKVNGITPHVISMDDYFINRDDTPVDESGKRDYENLNTLDLPLLSSHLEQLAAGLAVEIPTYNFVNGVREFKGNVLQLRKNEIFILEGIHGLNDQVTSMVDKSNVFTIYISAMTQLNIDNHNRISTSDSRMLRRLVRDSRSRGSNGEDTIGIWPYVIRGEARNIFPFQENADVIFNSATVYELSVLKQFAEPVLFSVREDCPEYITAKRMIKFLDYFLGMPTDCIPQTSIVREFIGGSIF